MSEVQALAYRSEWGDVYFPVEHYTFEDALEEICDDYGWELDEATQHYAGIEAIPLHKHSLDGDEIYECPNYDDEADDEPGPCIGYVDCHVFE